VPDIAVTNQGSSTLGVYLGLGGATFASRLELDTPPGPSAVIASTLTSSGLPDIALVSQDPAASQGEVTVIQDSTNFANSVATGAAQTPYPASEYVDLGVKIKATPTLHPNNEVTLLLEFEIRALAGSSVNGIPVLSNRTLTQSVRVKEDEPTLIGGLTDTEEDPFHHGPAWIRGNSGRWILARDKEKYAAGYGTSDRGDTSEGAAGRSSHPGDFRWPR